MQAAIYELPVLSGSTRRAVSGWLLLGLASLIAAGVFSLLLVLARTPVIQGWIPFLDFFQVALVVHVNLSVLIWLLAVSAALWSLSTRRDLPLWDRTSFWLACSGTAIVVLAPFLGAGSTSR